MNSDQVFDAIERIAATPSKNEKVDQLAEILRQPNRAVEILKLAYDPMVTFGIGEKSIPRLPIEQPVDGLGRVFNEDTFVMLARMACRAVTGGAAVAWVDQEIRDLTAKSAELLKRILLKDMRAGFTDSSLNKACPGLIQTFDCMLAHSFSEHKHKLKYPLYVEPKLDGVRVLAFVNTDDQEVKFFSRSGKEFTGFEHLKPAFLTVVSEYRESLALEACDAYDATGLPDGENTDLNVLDDCYAQFGADDACYMVFDGEVVSGSFNKTVGDVRRKNAQAEDAKFYAFDLFTLEEFNNPGPKDALDAGTYLLRRNRLTGMLAPRKEPIPVVALPSWRVDGEHQIHALYQQMRDRGLEGVIVKDPDAPYFKKRSHAWTKIKAEESADLYITGAVEGTGKYAGMLGAIVVDFQGVSVNVGTGLDDTQRAEFWRAYIEGDLVGRLTEVQYHEVTEDGSLRHPRFVRFRDDKKEVSYG